jgi:hypothetical protein
MSQNEPVENAVEWIDRYINEASSQSRSDEQQLSPSLRLQALGHQKSDHSHRFLIFRMSNLGRKFQHHYCRMSFESFQRPWPSPKLGHFSLTHEKRPRPPEAGVSVTPCHRPRAQGRKKSAAQTISRVYLIRRMLARSYEKKPRHRAGQSGAQRAIFKPSTGMVLDQVVWNLVSLQSRRNAGPASQRDRRAPNFPYELF